MNKSGKIFIQALRGQATEKNPLWLMRQAGRYLPEYKETRAKAKDFLSLCLTPSLAFEATLQPMRRYNFDASIVFADILLVPHALGQPLVYKEKQGPILTPVRNEKDLESLIFKPDILDPVCETLSLMKARLAHNVARIGFCGGLWTVACYMIEGQGSKEGFKTALNCVEHQPAFMKQLIDILYESTLIYLCRQIDAGAEVIQIFESAAGLLTDKKFRKWIIDPTLKLVKALEEKYPNVPVIGFPFGASPADYFAYVNETGIDALSVDHTIPLTFAQKELQPVKPLQGNLDPALLVMGGEKMQKAVADILEAFGPNHIFNLGHGIVPETPPEHVAELVRLIREVEWIKNEDGGYSS